MAKRPVRRKRPRNEKPGTAARNAQSQQIEIKIEQNVPMKRAGHGWAKNLPFGDMEVGDSFELKHDDRWKTIESMMNSLRAASAAHGSKGGRKYSVRRWSKTSARLWRVK